MHAWPLSAKRPPQASPEIHAPSRPSRDREPPPEPWRKITDAVCLPAGPTAIRLFCNAVWTAMPPVSFPCRSQRRGRGGSRPPFTAQPRLGGSRRFSQQSGRRLRLPRVQRKWLGSAEREGRGCLLCVWVRGRRGWGWGAKVLWCSRQCCVKPRSLWNRWLWTG